MSLPGRRAAFLAMVPVCVVELMTTQDFAIINGALGRISQAFQVPVSQLHWAISAQMLTIGGLLVLAGWAGDRFGKRPIFIAGLCVMGAGNLLASLSSSFLMFLSARVLTGVGVAMMLPTALSLVADLFPHPGDRDRALSAISVSQLVGLPTGAFFGGLLLTHFGWQSSFLLNGGLSLVSITLAVVLLPALPRVAGRASDLDWSGIILVAACSVTLVWSISAIEDNGATSGIALGSIGGAVVLLAGLIAVERRSRFPILPAAVVKRPSVIRAASLIAVLTCLNVGLIFAFSLSLQAHGPRPSASTWVLFFPMAIGSFVGSLLIAPLIKRTSRGFMVFAGVLTDVLLVVCYVYLLPDSMRAIPLIMFGASVCMLAVFVPIQTEVFGDIPESMRGIVSSLIRMSAYLPTGIGVAVAAGAYATGGNKRALLSAGGFGVLGLIVFALTSGWTTRVMLRQPRPVR